MFNIVLFGPPGAGKGTQALLLRDKYRLVHISTGDVFRYHLKNDTELGKIAKTFMDAGNLVPDELTIDMLRNEVARNPNANGFIFDGFPRTISQAEALDALLRDLGTAVSVTLALEVDEEELVRRILERGKESGRVDDQDENTIRNRMVEYNGKTRPLKDYYENQGKLLEIFGIGEIDQIFLNLCRAIDQEMAKREVKKEIETRVPEEEYEPESDPVPDTFGAKEGSAEPPATKKPLKKKPAKKKPAKKKPAKKKPAKKKPAKKKPAKKKPAKKKPAKKKPAKKKPAKKKPARKKGKKR
jgi:adenylate kinase